MVFTFEGLRHLFAEAGVGQVLLGSDFPAGWMIREDWLLARLSGRLWGSRRVQERHAQVPYATLLASVLIVFC